MRGSVMVPGRSPHGCKSAEGLSWAIVVKLAGKTHIDKTMISRMSLDHRLPM